MVKDRSRCRSGPGGLQAPKITKIEPSKEEKRSERGKDDVGEEKEKVVIGDATLHSPMRQPWFKRR